MGGFGGLGRTTPLPGKVHLQFLMIMHVVLQGRVLTFLVTSDSSTVVLLLNVSSFV